MAARAITMAWAAGIVLALLIVLMPSTARSGPAAPVRLAIIVHPQSPFDDLELGTLRQLFKGERVAIKGVKLIPLNHPPRTVDRAGFDRTVLGMSPEEVSKHWIDRRIRGQSGPPRVIDSPELLRRFVSRVPGSVAYLRVQHVGGDLKIVAIDGKRVDDPKYPIQF